MLAKLHVLVAFELTIPQGETYKPYGHKDDGYNISFDLPSSSDKPRSSESPEYVEINGKSTIHADVINITFQKASFERAVGSPTDPPDLLIQKTLNYFLERLKYVSRYHLIKPIEFDSCQWTLNYLNDDGTELEKTEGLVRSRFRRNFSCSILGCDPALWDQLFTLPQDFEAPAWHTLLIDSMGSLPHIGTALVLAATALEVFIAELLNRLVKEANVSVDLWDWINDRGNWQKEPSTEEQYDVLLKVMTGHSLKEDNALWEGLKNIRVARNSFVHEGVAKLGKATLSLQDTLPLLARADAIVTKIREWIPDSYRWPLIERTINIQMTKRLVGDSNSPLNTAVSPIDKY